MNLLATIVVVTNIGFTACYDTDHRRPVWVAYDLEPNEVVVTNRASHTFKADPRIPESDNSYQYKMLGMEWFDRGHLAPAADFNWSQDALKETYYFSNVCPMYRGLNRGRWAETEKLIRELAKRGTVHVVVYPVYMGHNLMVNVAPLPSYIPTAFIKVFYGWFGCRHIVEENYDVSELPIPL